MEEKQVDHESDEFPLYTEKIIVNPKKKYRRLINLLWVAVCAVIFGILASFVMVIVFPMINQRAAKPSKGVIHLEIDKDEYIIRDNTDEYESSFGISQTQASQENAKIASAEEIVESVYSSMVVINYRAEEPTQAEDDEVVLGDFQSVGLIIGDVGDDLIIVTNDRVTANHQCQVIFGETAGVEANMLGTDRDSGLSMISVNKHNISDFKSVDYSVAILGNSYMLKPDDEVIAVGKLKGTIIGASVGKITSLDTESVVDNVYDILKTDINAAFDDYCFLFNNTGSLVGISKMISADDPLSVMGLSNVKALIERLTENKPITYFGVKTENVTPSISEKYNLPMGIYITSVEIDSPAYQAGLQAGDVIVAVNYSPVLTMQLFSEKLCEYTAGQNISVTVKRAGRDNYRELVYDITLSARN